MTNTISQSRAHILERITARAKAVGRPADDITLIAVSKVQPDARIEAMLAAGQTVFGENRVQEAQARWSERFEAHKDKIELRLIGPLQTNKATQAVELFGVIETLDREKLAKSLVNAMTKTGKTPQIYVQVNTGAEPQKAGVLPENLDAFIKTLRANYDINPAGLMCIPPAFEKYVGQFPGHAPGPHFALLKKLAERNAVKQLSMGMSSDFDIAIDFGATHVRIGSALFGARV